MTTPSRYGLSLIHILTRADTITVPAGYKATTFIPWGTPIRGSFPAFLENAGNSAADQADQIGMHHDCLLYTSRCV